MIELRDVTKIFNAGRPNEFAAVRSASLTVEARGATALTGPSGSGKTTLLGLIGCMARPTSGRISFRGEVVSGLPERFLTEFRRRTFGFVFQQFHLIRGLSARENVMLPAYPLGEPLRKVRAEADRLLERLGIGAKADAGVEWLSGGEAQRVAIARALINNPPVIIADEPTAHLDTALSLEFIEVMRGIREEGRTLIVASHDPLVYESDLIDRVVRVRDGRVAEAPDRP
ncbi:MAG: ABC transporter ATP-binding protein [Thermodesulfobacteriota bacterium]